MSDPSCVFCEIVSKRARAAAVFETQHAMCFLPLEMEVDGHVIVAPKAHHVTIFEISDEAFFSVMGAVKEAALRLRASLGATGVNVLHASGRSAQQSVDHFHMHVLPRFEGDGFDAWPSLPGARADRAQLLARLR